MNYKNVTKEQMVKDNVINDESKSNSAEVNYHLIFKCDRLERQNITAE